MEVTTNELYGLSLAPSIGSSGVRKDRPPVPPKPTETSPTMERKRILKRLRLPFSSSSSSSSPRDRDLPPVVAVLPPPMPRDDASPICQPSDIANLPASLPATFPANLAANLSAHLSASLPRLQSPPRKPVPVPAPAVSDYALFSASAPRNSPSAASVSSNRPSSAGGTSKDDESGFVFISGAKGLANDGLLTGKNKHAPAPGTVPSVFYSSAAGQLSSSSGTKNPRDDAPPPVPKKTASLSHRRTDLKACRQAPKAPVIVSNSGTIPSATGSSLQRGYGRRKVSAEFKKNSQHPIFPSELAEQSLLSEPASIEHVPSQRNPAVEDDKLPLLLSANRSNKTPSSRGLRLNLNVSINQGKFVEWNDLEHIDDSNRTASSDCSGSHVSKCTLQRRVCADGSTSSVADDTASQLPLDCSTNHSKILPVRKSQPRICAELVSKELPDIASQADISFFSDAPPLVLNDSDGDCDSIWAVPPERPSMCLLPIQTTGSSSRDSQSNISQFRMSIYDAHSLDLTENDREFYPGDDQNGINSTVHANSSTPFAYLIPLIDKSVTSAPPVVNQVQPLPPSKDDLIQFKPLPTLTLQDSYHSPTRQNSFKKHDDVWAVRPPTEVVYDRLEEFFPDHDLDKPILVDEDEPFSTTGEHPLRRSHGCRSKGSTGTISIFNRSEKPNMRMKSIRLVAKEACEARSRSSSISRDQPQKLLRRKSTKLWGTKLVEMKPEQEEHGQTAQLVVKEADINRQKTFKWVKGELIGKGTYGSVYLAMNATTGDMLAVKQVELPSSINWSDDERLRCSIGALNIEIETLKDLDHVNIVQYLGCEKTDQFISIFLEYVPGGSIGRCFRKHGPFDEAVIRSLIRQTLDGLSYLHQRCILHRDLKADNLLLDVDGTCKISDFGISKRSKDVYANNVNMSMQGTIYWMAPEVFSGTGYSAKVDIWSLGCVVLEMFAGRRPWSNHEAFAAMYETGRGRAPPIPSDVYPRMSAVALDFLGQCFRISPNERPTAENLLKHPFCQYEKSFNWFDTKLAKLIKAVV